MKFERRYIFTFSGVLSFLVFFFVSFSAEAADGGSYGADRQGEKIVYFGEYGGEILNVEREFIRGVEHTRITYPFIMEIEASDLNSILGQSLGEDGEEGIASGSSSCPNYYIATIHGGNCGTPGPMTGTAFFVSSRLAISYGGVVPTSGPVCLRRNGVSYDVHQVSRTSSGNTQIAGLHLIQSAPGSHWIQAIGGALVSGSGAQAGVSAWVHKDSSIPYCYSGPANGYSDTNVFGRFFGGTIYAPNINTVPMSGGGPAALNMSPSAPMGLVTAFDINNYYYPDRMVNVQFLRFTPGHISTINEWAQVQPPALELDVTWPSGTLPSTTNFGPAGVQFSFGGVPVTYNREEYMVQFDNNPPISAMSKIGLYLSTGNHTVRVYKISDPSVSSIKAFVVEKPGRGN